MMEEFMQLPGLNSIRWYVPLFIAAVTLAFPIRSSVQASPAAQGAKEQAFVVEYYYKAKWGHADEFIALFKKNHYPLLKKEMELGRILKVTAVAPRNHATEDSRWDYRL